MSTLSHNTTFHSLSPSSTFSGDKALNYEEDLIFTIGDIDKTGVDFDDDISYDETFLNGITRHASMNLPGLSEPEAVRHYVRLSTKNHAIDTGIFPLGSCTMKHNPRLNEKIARLKGFCDIHPLQPISTVQGALQIMHELSQWLCEITGMESIALSPKAGAHGELCGVMAIKAALQQRKDNRRIMLVSESAHGTNPSTAILSGFEVQSIKTNAQGTISLNTVKEALNDNIAGVMLTNPNTCGLYEPEIVAIADAIHDCGGYFYCDGANLNAILGKAKIADLGVDAMHINLHKTFSTPHGGGGPGAGPVVLSKRLAPYAPLPYVELKDDGTYALYEHKDVEKTQNAFGRITAFHGQMGMFVRSLSYMLSHGSNGLTQISEDAVLNANYLRTHLEKIFGLPFNNKNIMHELLLDNHFLQGTNITTLDFAKALIDEGFHPMTVYFPLIVDGAMLIEPTESETRQSLDAFIHTMISLANAAQKGDTARFLNAPLHAPRKRIDETLAARKPILVHEQN